MGYSVLLIEDRGLTTESVYPALLNANQEIALAHTPEKVSATLATAWPDVIIFNLLGGSLDLAQFDRVIGQTGLDIPRLVLLEKVLLYPISADAFIRPPYTTARLLQQLDQMVAPDRFLRVGEFNLDTHRKTLLHAGKHHRLTPKIYRLLRLLMEHESQIVYRKTIMKEVWETDYMGDTRTLDVHVRWIREKIEADPSHPRHLLTIRGVGYRFKGTVGKG